MNDDNLADQVREIAEKMHSHANYSNVLGTEEENIRLFADQLVALLPRPTMADMTEEERHECRWMQCDAGPYGRRGLIIDTGEWAVYVVDKETGLQSNYSPDLVTARPDLPRMEWNGTEKAEDESTVKVGDEIESADDPRLATLPVGSILLDSDGEKVTKFDVNPAAWRGPGYVPIAGEGTAYGSWVVVRIGQEADQ